MPNFPKSKPLANLLRLILLLSLSDCQMAKPAQPVASPSATPSTSPSTDPSSAEAVSLDWFASSKLRGTDRVSAAEAEQFVQNVYQTLDQKIFDPAFKQAERQQGLAELLTVLITTQSITRAELTERVNQQLQQLGTSHIRLLDPIAGEKLFLLFEQAPPVETEPAVSAQMQGEIGVLRIKSFIVPQISKAAIDRAKAQLATAKVMLLDLQGNGGGDIPSLIEDIVGPDKIMTTDRTRQGLAVPEPFVFRGYYNDTTGEAGPDLLAEKGYIQWRTRLEAQPDPRPCYILVDDQCGSACEVFAAIAQENGAAKILGVRTMGAVLAGEAFRLQWPGFALIAPTAQVFSPQGRLIEGVGVSPDLPIPECADQGSHCLEKAIALIRANQG